VLSADYEGITFVESMRSYAFQEKWQILKVVWLTEDPIGNGTKTELKDVVGNTTNDVIVMHSRLWQDAQLFEIVQELGLRKQKAVWIITEITSHQFKNCQKLPQGLLKISLKRPEKHHDYVIYENALHDAVSLFQLSFEESLKEYSLNFNVEDCGQRITRDRIRRISKRYLPLNFQPLFSNILPPREDRGGIQVPLKLYLDIVPSFSSKARALRGESRRVS